MRTLELFPPGSSEPPLLLTTILILSTLPHVSAGNVFFFHCCFQQGFSSNWSSELVPVAILGVREELAGTRVRNKCGFS